jgi:hypothetical protein
MQVDEILCRLEEFSGKVVTIEGVFVMKNDIAYLVANEANADSSEKAIGVEGNDLKKRLFSRVPAYGGSQFSYCDPAKITGIILRRGGSDFSSSLVEIEKFEIDKYGEQLMVIP